MRIWAQLRLQCNQEDLLLDYNTNHASEEQNQILCCSFTIYEFPKVASMPVARINYYPAVFCTLSSMLQTNAWNAYHVK